MPTTTPLGCDYRCGCGWLAVCWPSAGWTGLPTGQSAQGHVQQMTNYDEKPVMRIKPLMLSVPLGIALWIVIIKLVCYGS